MPLKIQLRKSQKIIINGAVLENITSHNVSLLVMNDAAILRDSDILTPEDAKTPAGQVYYFLQCVYLFPADKERFQLQLVKSMGDYMKLAPSSEPIMTEIKEFVEREEYYPALKAARKLITHEQKVLSHVQEKLNQELCGASAGGKSAGGGGLGDDPGGAEDEGGERK